MSQKLPNNILNLILHKNIHGRYVPITKRIVHSQKSIRPISLNNILNPKYINIQPYSSKNLKNMLILQTLFKNFNEKISEHYLNTRIKNQEELYNKKKITKIQLDDRKRVLKNLKTGYKKYWEQRDALDLSKYIKNNYEQLKIINARKWFNDWMKRYHRGEPRSDKLVNEYASNSYGLYSDIVNKQGIPIRSLRGHMKNKVILF